MLFLDDVWLQIMLEFAKYVNHRGNAQCLSSMKTKFLEVSTWNETSKHKWDEFFELILTTI